MPPGAHARRTAAAAEVALVRSPESTVVQLGTGTSSLA
jgi:hypothetical protein